MTRTRREGGGEAEWDDSEVDTENLARREYFAGVFESAAGTVLICVGLAAVLGSEPWGVVWCVPLLFFLLPCAAIFFCARACVCVC